MTKNNLKILASFILGFFFVFFVSPVLATSYYSENFDSANVGDDGSDFTTQRYDMGVYIGNWNVVSVQSQTSPHSYKADNTYYFYTTADLSTPTSLSNFWVGFQAYVTGNGQIEFWLCGNDYSNNPACASNEKVYFRLFLTTTKFNILDMSTGGDLIAVNGNYTGDWHKISLNINTTAKTFYAYLDGNILNGGNSLNLDKATNYPSAYPQTIKYLSTSLQNTIGYLDDVIFSDSTTEVPPEIDGVCGSANGNSYSALPTDAGVLCSVGTPSGSIFSFDVGWIWTCYGQNGGDDAICNATFDANAQAIDAVCGDDDGQTLSSPPTDFCNAGDLIVPSFVSTSTGWSWTCAGIDGGIDAFCSAKNTDFVFPDIPAPTDCSGLSVPEKWFCDITNTLKGLFLPSDDAIKTLNNTIASVKQKAPFCYISAMDSDLKMLQVAKDTNDSAISLSFTFGTDTSGHIDLDTFGTTGKFRDLMVFIRAIISFIVVLVFIFWAFSFTKRIFK